MTDYDTPAEEALVRGPDRQLTQRSQALARRALDDIARITPSPEEIDRLLVAGAGVDLDAFAAAAKAIIQLPPPLDIQDDTLGTLVFDLVYALQRFFPSEGEPVLTPSCRGERYFPPNEELRDLLVRALQSLVGPFSDPNDAIIAAFTRGGPATRVEAAGWLHGTDIPHAATLLQDALAETDDPFFALVLRFALVWHDKEDYDAIVDGLADHMPQCSSEMQRHWCGQTLFELGWPVSADRLGGLVCALGSSPDDDARSWALPILTGAFLGGADDPQDEEEGIKRLKDCSDDVLEGLTRFAWLEFLRENHLQEPYVSLPVSARGNLLDTLQQLVQRNQVRWDTDERGRLAWPKPADRYADLCWHLTQLLEHAQARRHIEVYRDAVQSAPNDASARRSLASALALAGFSDDSIAQCRHVARLTPLSASAHQELASELETVGQLEEAIREYARAIKLSPSSLFARRRLVHALRKANRFDEAIVEARQLLRIAQRSRALVPMAHTDLARALQDIGELNDALGHHREAERLSPNTAYTHYALAQCLYDLGHLSEALSHFRTAADLGYDFARAKAFQCQYELNKTQPRT